MLNWSDMPSLIKNESVYTYYLEIIKKRKELIFIRFLDVFFSLILLIITLPLFFLIGIFIKIDSSGPIFFKQIRVTQYGRNFEILKFRTMKIDICHKGNQITSQNDLRITGIGNFLRKYRLDELPQLINILCGDMTFVGTRPEVPIFVEHYSDEMLATLLLKAGVTSLASIEFKDENEILKDSKDVNDTYISEVLPKKMAINLSELKELSIRHYFKVLFLTLIGIFK